MINWKETSLGEFSPFHYGKGLPERNRIPGDIPVLSSAGFTGSHNQAFVQSAGIVIGRKGTVGSIHITRGPFWPIDTVFFIADEPQKRDLRFTYFLLQTLNLDHMNSDSAVPGLNRDNAHALKVRIPILPEQRAIAHILGSLDDKIELNRQMNETLEAMARALFKDWFVDFGPVRAKMAGIEPPGLAADIAALFPATLDAEGKPEGWINSRIGDQVGVVGGSTPSTKEPAFWNNGTHYWATPKDLSPLASPVLLSTERQITDAGLAQISSRLLPIGTVLLSSRAPIGYLAIAEVPTAINQGFIALICDQRLPNLFVLLWCKEYMDLIISNANGSTFQEISKTNFRPLPVIVPSDAILSAFIEVVNPLYWQIVVNLRESQTLTDLRDLLLPKLLSGEIRIREAEHLVGELV